MNGCKLNSKKVCSNCPYLGYCDKANVCDGRCYECDITACENNPNYKEKENG